MSDVENFMSDIEHPMSDVENPVSDIIHIRPEMIPHLNI